MVFRGRLGKAVTVCGGFGIIGGLISQIRPLWGDTVNIVLCYTSISVLGVAVIIGLVRAPYLVHLENVEEENRIKEEKRELERRIEEGEGIKKIRTKIGQLLSIGQVIMNRCQKESENAPIDEVDKWVTEVERYLTEKFDISYVAIFRNTAGVPTGVTSIRSKEHRDVWSFTRTRLHQLEKILSEMGE